MGQVVFGSEEAQAILKRDKVIAGISPDEFLKHYSKEGISQQLKDLDADIEATERELHRLRERQTALRERLFEFHSHSWSSPPPSLQDRIKMGT